MIEVILAAAGAGLVGTILGMGIGGSIEQRKHLNTDPQHEHTWAPWTEPEIAPFYEGDDEVGFTTTQHRDCLSCGYRDTKHNTYWN